MRMKRNEHDLDRVIEEMIDTVKNSKDEIFNMGEESRAEYEALKAELDDLKEKVVDIIEEGDELERKSRLSRTRLSEVSKNFTMYSEEKIREVYDQAHQLQTELTMKREKEVTLRERRDEIERRLKAIEHTVERAEGLVGKISVVLNYLNEDFKEVSTLIQNAQEKQAFGLKIIEAQEEERRRLSREIHDGPAQMLANILLRSDLVGKTYRERSVEQAVEEMKSVRSMIRTSLQEVRRIIYDLRPMALDDLGLVPTIKKYIMTTEDYSDLDIEFVYHGPDKRLSSNYEVALFRLMQESIQNAMKHAEASHIKVRLERTDDQVTLCIVDNGKGFNPGSKKEKSFGLIGMQERVEMLDGSLLIDSKVGSGTKITIRMPLKEYK